jgi:hypothetical protein
MDMLRCPACDGVLEPFQREQQDVLGCQSCGRCYSPDYLEELEGWYEQGNTVPSRGQQMTPIAPPDFARRVQAATKPGLTESQRLKRVFLQGWSSVFGFFILAGVLQWADTRDWKTLLILIGVGAVVGVGSGLIWVCFFLRSAEHLIPVDMTAGEAIEQLRQHNRKVLGRENEETDSRSALPDVPTAQDRGEDIIAAERMIRPTEDRERDAGLVTPNRAVLTPFVVKSRTDPRTKRLKWAFWCGWFGAMAIASEGAATKLERAGGDMGKAITIMLVGCAAGVVAGVMMMILVGGLSARPHVSEEAVSEGGSAGEIKNDSPDAPRVIPNPSEQASQAIQKLTEEIQQ